MVVAVALAPFRSVAAMLMPTDVVALGRSLLAATQEPLPESVRVTVRVVLVEEPFSTNVATTLLIGDSSDTGTCTVRFAQFAPLKRTVIAPICGARPTAPVIASDVVDADDRIAAANENRPSGKVPVLE